MLTFIDDVLCRIARFTRLRFDEKHLFLNLHLVYGFTEKLQTQYYRKSI